MQTCSNCGSEVRDGAKFCTTCGSRLNASTSTTDGGSTWANAPSDNAPAADVTDAGRDSTTEDPVNQPKTEVVGERDDAVADVAPVEEQTSTWSWESEDTAAATADDSTNDEALHPETETSTPAEEEPGVGDSSEVIAPEPQDRSGSTFNWSWNPPPTPESAETEADSVDEAAAETAGEDQPAVKEDAPGTADVEDRESANESLASWASTWSDPAAAQDVAATEPESADLTKAAHTTAPADDEMANDAETTENARARAEQLLEELRGLLPALSASPAPVSPTDIAAGSGHDHSAIVQDLESARNAVADPVEIRAALEASRDNPRDITTIMELAGQSTDMLAILEDRDHLVAAIDRAIEALG